MPSRRFLSPRRQGTPSSSSPSNDSTSARGSTPVPPNTRPISPTAPQQAYPDYINNDTDHLGWNAAHALASIRDDIPALPRALAGPLTQVLDVASEVINAVKTMPNEKYGCAHLIFRVLKFLQPIVGDLKGREGPIPDDKPTAEAEGLLKLKSALMIIRDDAIRWSRFSLLGSHLKRDEVKAALLRHNLALGDCFTAFHLLVSLSVYDPVDGEEVTARPGSSMLGGGREGRDGPLLASEDPSEAHLAGLHASLQRPIRVAVQKRLEEMGLRVTSTSSWPRSPAVNVLQTERDRNVLYLTSQISELTAEVGKVVPDILVATDTRFVERATHQPQTGDRTYQVREAVLATLRLLTELRSTPHVELDAAMLADKIIELSLNLSDLSLLEEAIEAQTAAVTLRRARGDISGLASSLTELSRTLSQLDRREEALKASEEAVSMYRLLLADQPVVFRPDLARSLVSLSTDLSEVGRHQEALEANEEAVAIFRSLAAERPAIFNPDLANALSNCFTILSELDRMPAALPAIQEAVNLFRSLVSERPAIFSAILASSLIKLSGCYSNMGRHEDALQARKEAEGLDQ